MAGRTHLWLWALAFGWAPLGMAEEPPIARVRVLLVDQLKLTPLTGIAVVPKQGIELALEAEDEIGLQLAVRPVWLADGPLSGLLKRHPRTRTCTIAAATTDAVHHIRVHPSSKPEHLRRIPLWRESPPPIDLGRPLQLAPYLHSGAQLHPVGDRAIYARPGQTARLVILGRYRDGSWRAAAIRLPAEPTWRRAASSQLRWKPTARHRRSVTLRAAVGEATCAVRLVVR